MGGIKIKTLNDILKAVDYDLKDVFLPGTKASILVKKFIKEKVTELLYEKLTNKRTME